VKTFFAALKHEAAGTFRLLNARTGGVLAETILPAFDSTSRRTGLLRHDSLPQGTAMIIAPTSAIHTFFMRFPIDVAFLSPAGVVLSARHNLVPWRMAAAWRAHGVVEMPVGTLARTNTNVGDSLQLEPREVGHPGRLSSHSS
jgi:uncharacterized membrane protein (UPF0127 family)